MSDKFLEDLRQASLDKYTDKFKSQIYINGKKKHIGLFTTPEEAHAAYWQRNANITKVVLYEKNSDPRW